MKSVKKSRAQHVKRYLVNKVPHMSENELLVVRSMIDDKLKSFSRKTNLHETVTSKKDEWEDIQKQLQSKLRYQLLYNAIQSRLISAAHVSE